MSVTSLLVLGMHRSGTSALAGTLVRLGGNPPANLLLPDPGNERGYWESDVIMTLNDEVLASGGSSWHDWRPFDPEWYNGAAARDFRARAVASLIREFGDSALPVVKDPRICRLMPLWLSVFRELRWPVHVLLPVRSPLEVAGSLHRRDGMSLSCACLLWLRHVLDAEAESRGLPRAVIDVNGFLADWRPTLARAADQASLVLPDWSDTNSLQVDEFLSADLRHHRVEKEALECHRAVSDWIRETYAIILNLVENPDSSSTRNALDEMRARFDDGAQNFSEMFRELTAQKVAQLAAKDAQLREAWHHLDRINASRWWRFGMAVTRAIKAGNGPFKLSRSVAARPSEAGSPHKDEFLDTVVVLPLGYQLPDLQQIPRLAVLLHAYYVEDLPDFQEALRNIPFSFALFVSTDSEQKRAVIEESFANWDRGLVEVRIFPNRGRDIAPKFVGFRDVYQEYEFVLHIHTKRSSADLADWRPFLLKCLLGSPQIVAGILEMFGQCADLGIVAPRNFRHIRPWMTWGINFNKCAKLAKQMGIKLRRDSPLDFATGSMFWARSAALEPLLDLNLTFDSFEEEGGQINGALGHAIERLTFYSCEAAGYSWCHAGPAEDLTYCEKAINISRRDDLAKIPFVDLLSPTDRAVGERASRAVTMLEKMRRLSPIVAALNIARGVPYDFDLEAYRTLNLDVAEADIGPYWHWREFGKSEGRCYRALKSQKKLNLAHRVKKPLAILQVRRMLHASREKGNFSAFDSSKRNILIIVHEASRTGAPILGWNLVSELQERYNVVVLIMRGGSIEQAFRDKACAVVRLPDKFPLKDEWLEAVVDQLVRIYSPAYAIANSVETRCFVPYIERAGVPVVALVHEFSCYTWPSGTLNSLFGTASHIVFSAKVVADNAVKDYKILKGRDFKILAQGRSKLPPNAGAAASAVSTKVDIKGLWPNGGKNSLLVVGMGAIQLRKGIDFFISVAASVRRALPNREIRFAWVGKCYPKEKSYLSYLREQVERSGLGDTFCFVDEVANLQPIYDQMDIFFLSSRLDPLPNVAIDSALQGIPVVCFDQASGMPEILVNAPDTRELVVPHLDAGAAAAVICDLLENPTRLARSSKAIRAAAEARFDMKRYIGAIDELGRKARTARDQSKCDHTLISKSAAFNADLYLTTSESTLSAAEGLSNYLNASRLMAPRRRPNVGLFLRRPLEGFHPLIYASENPDFDEKSGEDPLAHYIRTGRPSGRWTHQVLRPDLGQPVSRSDLSIAVHAHFHYPELFPNFLARLKRNVAAADLYVTTTSAIKAKELARLTAASNLERTKITVVPNRGRDLGAMLSGLGQDWLSGYDIVGHFHGKRSPQFDKEFGDRRRNFLWEHLLGGKFAMLDFAQAAFATDKDLGILFEEDPHLNDWDDNRACADQLAARMGIALPLPNQFDFPMGTMFWARTAALKPLFDLKLTWDDYPEEPLPCDGTILHALERLLPFIASKEGYGYATTYVKRSLQ